MLLVLTKKSFVDVALLAYPHRLGSSRFFFFYVSIIIDNKRNIQRWVWVTAVSCLRVPPPLFQKKKLFSEKHVLQEEGGTAAGCSECQNANNEDDVDHQVAFDCVSFLCWWLYFMCWSHATLRPFSPLGTVYNGLLCAPPRADWRGSTTNAHTRPATYTAKKVPPMANIRVLSICSFLCLSRERMAFVCVATELFIRQASGQHFATWSADYRLIARGFGPVGAMFNLLAHLVSWPPFSYIFSFLCLRPKVEKK